MRNRDIVTQLRPYLPFKLFNELALNPSESVIEQCTSHLNALLHTVSTYCSPPILQDAQCAPANVHGKWIEATLLFADISGFTALSERLNARGRAGAEEITRIVNNYFTVMVEILRQNGGGLLKFGGDAMLGSFEGVPQNTARRAAQAALAMQCAMEQFAEIETSVGRFALQMKVGLHTGQIFTAHVGSSSQTEYWLTGNDVNHTALSEEAAVKGQVVVSEATWKHLEGWIQATALPGPKEDPTFYLIPVNQSIHPLKIDPMALPSVPYQDISRLLHRLDTLTPYLPTGLLPRLVYNPGQLRVEGEHRLVAVLFVNILGFSQLAAELGNEQPQALTEIMQDYFSTVQSIVSEHGGTINKTDLYSTGDKLLIIFGAPIAHEDDVDQAARSAVAMQATLEQVNRRLRSRYPKTKTQLRQRIGISTGHVFSGNVGAEISQEYTIMGDEVNLAARLMSASVWGESWVSSHVFYWLEPFGTFETVGTLPVKGKKKPVPTYRLMYMGETHRPHPPFVDRVEARATLNAHLSQLIREGMEGWIITITGEPGIGKSRLWSELQTTTLAQNTLWLTGKCREQRPAYQLFADILRNYLSLSDNDTKQVQQQALVRKITELFEPERVDSMGPFLSIVLDLHLKDEWKERVSYLGEQLVPRLVREVTTFLERLTYDQPLVLVCDDVHWLDTGSTDILLQLIELVEYAPILLGFTLRPGQYAAYERIAGALSTRFGHWYKEIALKALDAEYGNQIISAVAGQSVSREQLAMIHSRSGGNPLFVTEITRAVVTDTNIAIPDAIHKIIESRRDALPEGPRQTLKAASVVGHQFSLVELLAILENESRDIRRHLATLRRMHMIDIAENGFRFVHALTQEVIYQGLDHKVRQDFHLRLATFWQAQGNAAQAAQHFLAGGEWKLALEQGAYAAEQHWEQYAHQEAIRLYELALKAAQELHERVSQARLWGKMAQIHLETGDYAQAETACQEKLALLRPQARDSLKLANVHYVLGRVYDQWGKYEQALVELERGLELAGLDASVTRAQLLIIRCSVLINTGQLDKAEQDGLTALHIAEILEAPLEQAYACNNLGAVYGTRGQYEDALRYHQMGLRARRNLNVAYDISQSLVNVGTALSYLKKFQSAQTHYQEALALQKHIGDRRNEGHSYHNLGWLYWDQGELEKAEKMFIQALAIWQDIDHRRGVAFIYNDLGGLYQEQARFDEAREYLEKSACRYEAIDAKTYLPENYMALAQVYLALEQTQDALTAAQQALHWAEQNCEPHQIEATTRLLEAIDKKTM